MGLVSSHDSGFQTFDDAGELLHVVVSFPVVNHSGDREQQLGLDLREPVQNALTTPQRGRYGFKQGSKVKRGYQRKVRVSNDSRKKNELSK